MLTQIYEAILSVKMRKYRVRAVEALKIRLVDYLHDYMRRRQGNDMLQRNYIRHSFTLAVPQLRYEDSRDVRKIMLCIAHTLQRRKTAADLYDACNEFYSRIRQIQIQLTRQYRLRNQMVKVMNDMW